MILFSALVFLALAIAGFTAFVIFWPLTLVHLRDRHASLYAGFGGLPFFSPAGLLWLLTAGYAAAKDPNLTGLARPARLSLLTILIGLGACGLLWGVDSLVG